MFGVLRGKKKSVRPHYMQIFTVFSVTAVGAYLEKNECVSADVKESTFAFADVIRTQCTEVVHVCSSTACVLKSLSCV